VTPKLYVDIAIFHNKHDDLISLGAPVLAVDTTPAPPHFTISFPYVNGLKGNSDGFEIAPNWKLTSWWQLKATYSYLNLHLEGEPGVVDGGGYVSLDEGSSPHNQVTFESQFNLPKRFEFDQTYRYVSALPAQVVAGYSTADARFSWHFARQMEWSIVGQNLLQPHHPEFGGDLGGLVGIKRSAYAQITWTKAD
jgi:iron complex outermembrane recepter protein